MLQHLWGGIGAPAPAGELGAQNRAQKRVAEKGDSGSLATAPPLPPTERGPPLTWAPPPGSCGQRGELGDTSKSLSSSASPCVRGTLQGPGGGHGCSMSGCPRPYTPHYQRPWRGGNLLRGAGTPPQPAGQLPRMPLRAATPTHASRQAGRRPAEGDGLALSRDFRLWRAGPWEVHPGACVHWLSVEGFCC